MEGERAMPEAPAPPANIYAGSPATVLRVRKHTSIERSLVLDRALEGTPGQFVMASLPMAGEIPVSISGFTPSSIELTLRNVGAVTSRIFELETGDSLYIRGPYGNGFPLDQFEGQHLLIIAGGSALAPAKPLVEHCLSASRPRPEKLDLLVGFKSPRHVLFQQELNRWKKRCNVVVTVDNDEDHAWMGSIGFVVSFIKDVQHIGADTRVIIIGPPLMMTNSVRELLGHGVAEENIWLSLERHMKCGVGKCGHCRVRDKYVCTDGPVFRYQEAKGLID